MTTVQTPTNRRDDRDPTQTGGLLVLGIVGGYTGHALPDDLLSGTALRVVEGDKLLYGRETGRLVRSPDGGFSEIRVPLNRDHADEPGPEADENGIPTPRPGHAPTTEEISHDR